jgi:uncharacterized protein (TIGR03435 family)
MHLKFTADEATPKALHRDADSPAPETASEQTGVPAIFTAVQEQLGLKLVPTRGPTEVLVIDHVERRSEN